MFNPFKKLFGRRGGVAVEAAVEETQEFQPAPVTPTPIITARRSTLPRTVRVPSQSSAAAPLSNNGPASLTLPLRAILARLPAELMQRVRQMDVGEAEIFIPMQKVLSQISMGAVRLSFGELRQAAPPGTFMPENDRDRTLIELPLNEVLSRLNPALLARRPSQRHIEVPPEVTGPFGGQSRVQISTAPLKPAPAAPAQPEPQSQPAAAAPIQPASRPQPPAAMPSIQPAPRFQPPVAPIQPAPRSQPQAMPAQTPVPFRPPAAPTRTPAAPTQFPVASPQPVVARMRPVQPLPTATPSQPVSTPATSQPVLKKTAPLPTSWEAEPVFKRTFPAPIATPVPPAITPIAPQIVREQSGETEVISNPASFGNLSAAPAPAAPVAPITPIPVSLEPEPTPVAPTFAPPPPPDPFMDALAGETRFLHVSLADLSLSWPEAVRQEIHALHLTTSQIGLPMGAVEGVIKSGKIAFPWKAVRSWIKPPLPPSTSQFDTTILELPLKVVTPLFLAELRAFKPQRKVSIDTTIPNLFYGGALPAEAAPAAPVVAPPPPVQASLPVLPVLPSSPASAPRPLGTPSHASAPVPTPVPTPPPAPESAKPADTNYYIWKDDDDTPDEAPVFAKKSDASGTAFLNRFATPNEIVNRAASLGGVDGALIALPDGLLVASRIPASMNADTIAAFLPSIFGRVSQCTRELRLGDLNNLNFTVGNIPWKIFRVGSIYFAVFGRPGEALPTAQLVGLVAELDRKAK